MNFKRQTFTQTLSNNRQNKILARILSIATIFNMIGTFPKNWLALRIPGCFFLHWPSAEKTCMIGWYFPWKKLALRILGQGLTSTRYPTRPELFFLLTEPDSTYFSKFPSLGFFPAGRFKSFSINPQILLYSSRPDTNSSVSKSKCLRYKKWIQGKSGKFDNWFLMHFHLIQSRQSNPRFIHVETIKSMTNYFLIKLFSNPKLP